MEGRGVPGGEADDGVTALRKSREEKSREEERGCGINSCVTVGGGSRNAAYVTEKTFYS